MVESYRAPLHTDECAYVERGEACDCGYPHNLGMRVITSGTVPKGTIEFRDASGNLLGVITGLADSGEGQHG